MMICYLKMYKMLFCIVLKINLISIIIYYKIALKYSHFLIN